MRQLVGGNAALDSWVAGLPREEPVAKTGFLAKGVNPNVLTARRTSTRGRIRSCGILTI